MYHNIVPKSEEKLAKQIEADVNGTSRNSSSLSMLNMVLPTKACEERRPAQRDHSALRQMSSPQGSSCDNSMAHWRLNLYEHLNFLRLHGLNCNY